MLAGIYLTHKAALWALLSLLIPVLIHLFNRSRGRLVRIGHIDLVRKAKQLQVTEVRLSQWLLLALRLGIFTVLALILAGLSSNDVNHQTGTVIYVTPTWLSSATQEGMLQLREDISTLPAASIRLLQPGYPELTEVQLENRATGVATTSDGINNIWPLLQERLEQHKHLGEVIVRSTDHALQFGHDRPALPGPVSWKLSHPETGLPPDTGNYHAIIAYQSERLDEAIFLEELFKLLKTYRLPNLSWDSLEVETLTNNHLQSDWLILLGDEGLSEQQRDLLSATSVVLGIYGDNSASQTQTVIDAPFFPYSRFSVQKHSISNDGTIHDKRRDSWQDLLRTPEGFPLLQQQQSGKSRLIQFNSRFDRQWSSMALQPEFPDLFLEIMLNDQSQLQRYSNARIGSGSMQQASSRQREVTSIHGEPLQHWLVALLILLWVGERWVSERRPRDSD